MSDPISTDEPIMERLKFPPHKAAMYLYHNDHRNLYQPLADWIRDQKDQYDWESDEAKQRAIATDECWTLHWYVKTPIGFNAVAAPTLSELLRLANSAV